MGSWGAAGKDALGGAAAGSVFGPWGAAAGGVLGGAYGLFSSDGDSGGYKAIESPYGGGEDRFSDFAKQEANRVQANGAATMASEQQLGRNIQETGYNAGNAALARDQGLGNAAAQQGASLGAAAQQRGQMLGGAAQSQAFEGQQAALAGQNRSNAYQNQAMGAANGYGGMSADERAQSQGSLARLENFYQQGPGPSAAEAQLRQGADQNMAQQIALARSGRGVGANAAAMRQAQFQNAATGQQMNQQASVLRANEAANWRQQQLGAMGMEQNTLAGMRQQDIGAQGQAYGVAGTMGQQGLGYGQLGANYQQIGNNAQATFEGQGLQGNLGFNQMGTNAQLGFEGMGNQTNLGFYNGSNNARLGFSQLGNQANQFGETMRNKILTWQGEQQADAQHIDAGSADASAARSQTQSAADSAALGTILNAAGAASKSGGGKTGTLDDYTIGANGYG